MKSRDQILSVFKKFHKMDNPNLTERLKCCDLTMVDNMSKDRV